MRVKCVGCTHTHTHTHILLPAHTPNSTHTHTHTRAAAAAPLARPLPQLYHVLDEETDESKEYQKGEVVQHWEPELVRRKVLVAWLVEEREGEVHVRGLMEVLRARGREGM